MVNLYFTYREHLCTYTMSFSIVDAPRQHPETSVLPSSLCTTTAPSVRHTMMIMSCFVGNKKKKLLPNGLLKSAPPPPPPIVFSLEDKPIMAFPPLEYRPTVLNTLLAVSKYIFISLSKQHNNTILCKAKLICSFRVTC